MALRFLFRPFLLSVTTAFATVPSIDTCDRPGPAPIIVSFEGGIGSGKTTQLELLRRMGGVLGVTNISSWPEPDAAFSEMDNFWPLAHQVDKLKSQGLPVDGELQFAINKVTLKVQTVVRDAYVARRAKAMAWACEAKQWGRPLVLLERTTGTQAHVFAPLLLEEGYLTDDGLREAETSLPTEPPADAWVFYMLRPDQVIERIRMRNRQGESAINRFMIDHMQSLSAKYFNHLKSKHGDVAIRWVDASRSIEEVLELTTQIVWNILHDERQGQTLVVRPDISALAHQVTQEAVLLVEVTHQETELSYSVFLQEMQNTKVMPLSIFYVAALVMVVVGTFKAKRSRVMEDSSDIGMPYSALDDATSMAGLSTPSHNCA